MEKMQTLARNLYAEQGMDTKEIAEFLMLDAGLINEWINIFEWQKLRTANNLSPSKLIQLYYTQSEAIMKKASDETRPLNLKEVDILNKLATAIQKIDKRLDTGVVMDVLKGFNHYLVKIKPQLTREMVYHEMEYVRWLMNEKK